MYEGFEVHDIVGLDGGECQGSILDTGSYNLLDNLNTCSKYFKAMLWDRTWTMFGKPNDGNNNEKQAGAMLGSTLKLSIGLSWDI